MRSNKSGLVGLITGAISTNAGFVKPTGLPDLFIVQGIQKAIDASGKTLLNSDTGGRSERVAELMRTFEEHRVEGMTYVGDHHRNVLLPEMSVATKLVLANCYDDAGTPSVLPTGKAVSFDFDPSQAHVFPETRVELGLALVGQLCICVGNGAVQKRG